MYYAAAVVAAILALLLITLYVLRQQGSFVRRHNEVHRELQSETTPTLEYDVPTGQDPVVILAALDRAGYTATVDPKHAHQRVLVGCPAGIDGERERVRSVIESASVTTPEDGVPMRTDVRFRDE